MDTESPVAPRRRTNLVIIAALLMTFCGFTALGIWQVHRLAWKRDLIARVDARVTAPPVAAPARTDWPHVSVQGDEYRRVHVTGKYLAGKDTLVDALTERGSGDWVLSPMQTGDGIVLLNRGFVPKNTPAAPVPGNEVTVTGLLRISEPDGRVLRPNQPELDRWFSRDVQAIAEKRGLQDVAPYFIDAAFDANAAEYPRGGMTVIQFRNNHLSYLLTWFTLALMTLFALWRLRQEIRARKAD